LQVAVVENGVRKTYSARYYNPATGRFLSRDPEDGNEFDVKTLHKYLYAGGDPVNASDPTGRTLIDFMITNAKVIGYTAIVSLVGIEIIELIECISEAVESVADRDESITSVGAPKKRCAIQFHDEWPTEVPEGSPLGPARFPGVAD
jgi:RHS repeat-associated protein